mgnify:CR=1 FL=1
MTPEQVVNAFCTALNDEGVEASLRYIADDCVYQNMPFPPVHGPQGVRDTLLGFFQITQYPMFQHTTPRARIEVSMLRVRLAITNP